jgi:RNA recognition motif-containing protein
MNNIRIENISPLVSEQNIRSMFAEHGAIERFKMMTDRWTGVPRGFGFIEMTNDADAEKAITALDGADFNGRTLKVKVARPQLHRTTRSKRS